MPQKCIASRNLTKMHISKKYVTSSKNTRKCIASRNLAISSIFRHNSKVHIVKYYKPQVCIPQEFTVYNPWKKDGTTVHNSFFHKLYLSSSRNLGKLFFHSVSRLNLVALKASACCSIVSRTIFQKHSDTAKLRFLVVI